MDILLPVAPVLVARSTQVLWLTTDGEVDRISPEEASRRVMAQPPLLVHMPATARRLGRGPFAAYDLLELFAFVHPARFCLPTPRGLIEAVGLLPFLSACSRNATENCGDRYPKPHHGVQPPS